MIAEISGSGLSNSVLERLGAAASQYVVDSSRLEVLRVRRGFVDLDESKSLSAQVSGLYAKLQARQDSLSEAASVIREVSATADKADQLLSQIEEDLGGVVKIYPPYPINSPERISLLNSFGGLRKQIEALTFPPPETLDGLDRVLGAQKDADAKNTVGLEQASVAALIKEPMWKIPELDPLVATDKAVSDAFDQVKSMRSILEDIQTRMWKDVISFVRQAESDEVQNEGSKTREQLSDLTANGEQGIGNNASQLAFAAESK